MATTLPPTTIPPPEELADSRSFPRGLNRGLNRG